MKTIAVQLLKAKGTGAAMGKSLSQEQLDQLNPIFQSNDVPTITKATLLTAILMLPPTNEESIWLKETNENPHSIPNDLKWILEKEQADPYQSLCLKLIQHTDLTEAEAQHGYESLIAHPDKAESAVFLEALRLKRETHIENLAETL